MTRIQSQPIWKFFEKSSVENVRLDPQIQDPVLPKLDEACIHLTGGDWDEYILRTHTRALGGISPTLRARIVRQLFPYKNFPSMKCTAQAPDNTVATSDVPANRNTEKDEAKWSEVELSQLDNTLRGWARWEVNYDQRYVKSTGCEGTTKNKSKICDKCIELAKDKGLKRSVQRVCRL